MTLCVCSSGERPCWLVASNRRALIRTAATESARVCRANPPSHAASNSAIPSRTEPSRAKPTRAEASIAPAHPPALYPSLPPHNTQPSRAEAISSRRNGARHSRKQARKDTQKSAWHSGTSTNSERQQALRRQRATMWRECSFCWRDGRPDGRAKTGILRSCSCSP